MEMDLALPSLHEDKLEIGGIDAHFPGMSGHIQENHEVVNNKGITKCEPHNGLEFDTKEAAYSLYREYARSVGFGITIKASRRSKKSGKFIDVKIACSRFGSKRDSSTIANSRSCPKTDCKASMHMKRKQDGKWFIYSFEKEHNHEICPDDFDHALRGRNKQPNSVAYQKKGLQLALDEGDFQLLLEHFMLMQDENPSFWYALDLDHEKRLRNVLWVDAKGRHDYNFFSDVVFFETSYIRNRYRIPFVPIFGVNHHFQFVLLGCALIGDETASSFHWLMRTWLRAMRGQSPKVIITDEDDSLKDATKEIFPIAHHCFSLWHVLEKLPENLGHLIDRFENFMLKFNKCVYRSWTGEQFEKRWWKMVNKFELGEDEWIQALYRDRKKWVPTYMRGIFLAGMSTTERSQSMSSFFDKHISKETTFKEFVDQYKVFLNERYEEEAKADFKTLQRQAHLRSLSPFEKQVSKVYTYAILKKFQFEVLGTVACYLHRDCEDESTVTFRVDDFEERQNYIVSWNEKEQNIYCLCRSFEYRGYLCRHAMVVLQMCGLSSIPSHYVLKRWTKDAVKIRQTRCEISKGPHHSRVQRFNELCERAIKLGEEGSLSQETYKIAFHALEEALKHCVGANHSVSSILEPSTLAAQGFLSVENKHQGSGIVKASKKKKARKKCKVQSEPRLITIGMQDSGQQMDQLNPRAHALENCYIPQQGQGMEIGSRASSLDGYYGSLQSAEGVGEFNSISSIREADYSNPPGLGHLYPIATRVGHYSNQQSFQGFDWMQ